MSDQWSLGVRHNFRSFITSVTYAGSRSRDLFTFIRGNPTSRRDVLFDRAGVFPAILISDPEGREAWYDANVGARQGGFAVWFRQPRSTASASPTR